MQLQKLDMLFANEINISIISQMEVLGFSMPDKTEAVFQDFIANSTIYKIEDEIINKTIQLRKNYKIKLPDAIIAATAIVNNLILITSDIKDFEKKN